MNMVKVEPLDMLSKPTYSNGQLVNSSAAGSIRPSAPIYKVLQFLGLGLLFPVYDLVLTYYQAYQLYFSCDSIATTAVNQGLAFPRYVLAPLIAFSGLIGLLCIMRKLAVTRFCYRNYMASQRSGYRPSVLAIWQSGIVPEAQEIFDAEEKTRQCKVQWRWNLVQVIMVDTAQIIVSYLSIYLSYKPPTALIVLKTMNSGYSISSRLSQLFTVCLAVRNNGTSSKSKSGTLRSIVRYSLLLLFMATSLFVAYILPTIMYGKVLNLDAFPVPNSDVSIASFKVNSMTCIGIPVDSTCRMQANNSQLNYLGKYYAYPVPALVHTDFIQNQSNVNDNSLNLNFVVTFSKESLKYRIDKPDSYFSLDTFCRTKWSHFAITDDLVLGDPNFNWFTNTSMTGGNSTFDYVTFPQLLQKGSQDNWSKKYKYTALFLSSSCSYGTPNVPYVIMDVEISFSYYCHLT